MPRATRSSRRRTRRRPPAPSCSTTRRRPRSRGGPTACSRSAARTARRRSPRRWWSSSRRASRRRSGSAAATPVSSRCRCRLRGELAVLCRSCRRQVPQDALFCGRCGAPQAKGVRAPLDLVIGETRVPLTQTVTLGRADSNDITLADPSVSRTHARVVVTASDTSIEDAGSSHGTMLDDRPLQGRAQLVEGSVVRLGDTVIRVERHPDAVVAGRTVMLDAVGVSLSSTGAVGDRSPYVSSRPRLAPGCALKQLEENEGPQRFILRDESGAHYLRMGDAEAALVRLLATDPTLEDLLAAGEEELGADGPARVARLLADLGEHGLLEGTALENDPFGPEPGFLERLFKPKEWAFSNPDRVFQAAYRF